MKKDFSNRKAMHDSVIAYLNGTTEKWSPIPKVGEFKNEFEAVNDSIAASQKDQMAAQVFVGKSKEDLKRIIATKADILNDGLEAFALVTNNARLESRMGDSLTTLLHMRNIDFVAKSQEILTEADNNIDALTSEYGVTQEQVKDLKLDIDSFLELNGQPRAYQIASAQATKSLEQLFSEANNILENKLDKVMKIFKRRDPNFYNGYLIARAVVNN